MADTLNYGWPLPDPAGLQRAEITRIKNAILAADVAVKAIEDDLATQIATFNAHTHTFASLTSRPTTVGGYDISDAYTKTQTDAAITAAINGLVDGAPGALNTLAELSAALGNNANYAATITTQLAAKLNATAYTASDVLTKLRTVDGAASQLDADLLDGLHASAFLRLDNSNKPTAFTVEWSDNTRYGLLEFRRDDGLRGAYVGYGNGGNTVSFALDNATVLSITGGSVSIANGGLTIAAGGLDVAASATVAGSLGVAGAITSVGNISTDTYLYGQYVHMSHLATQRAADTVFFSSTDGFIRKNNAVGMRASLSVPVDTTQVVAGNGLTGGGTLEATRTLTLGTPGSITQSSTNSVTATSHTHFLGFTAAEVDANTSSAATSYALGTYVLSFASGLNRNGAYAVMLDNNNTAFVQSGGASACAGSWRARGSHGGSNLTLMQRVA